MVKVPVKCLVKGCENRSNQGGFFPPDNPLICVPCFEMLKTGKVVQGETFIHDLRNKLINSSPRYR
jgi:hypothetical protein